MVPFVPVIVGLDESQLEQLLRRPGACEVAIRGDIGCTLMSCCTSLAVQKVDGTCGTVRWGGSRWTIGAIMVDGRVVQATATPDHPVLAAEWLQDSILVRRRTDAALHLLRDGTMVRTAENDQVVVRVEFVDQDLPDQQPNCHNPLRRQTWRYGAPALQHSPAGGALILPGDSLGIEVPTGE